jgi:hypothetical protein
MLPGPPLDLRDCLPDQSAPAGTNAAKEATSLPLCALDCSHECLRAECLIAANRLWDDGRTAAPYNS